MPFTHQQIANAIADEGVQTIRSEEELAEKFGQNAEGIKNLEIIFDLLKERGFQATRAGTDNIGINIVQSKS